MPSNKPFEKRKIKCPECGAEVEIFTGADNSGICDCGIDCDAVYRHAHYRKLSKKVADDLEAESNPPAKRRSNPFDFNMK